MNDLENSKFESTENFFSIIADGISKFRTTYFDAFQNTLNFISDYLTIIAQGISNWSKPYRAIVKLGENQYVCWDCLDDETIDIILQSNNLNKTMRKINSVQNYADIKKIALKCRQCSQIIPYKKIFDQSMDAFEKGNNDLALLGFFSVVDGLLSDTSNNVTTSIYKRADLILKKIEDNEDIELDDYATLSLLITFRDTMESLSANISFCEKEPKKLNRHWIMHGRSRKRKTKLDCIKIIRFIYGIILLDEFSKKNPD